MTTSLTGQPYARAFDPRPGACYRLVYGRANGYPERCWREVTTRGTLVVGKRWIRVESCEEHAGELRTEAT